MEKLTYPETLRNTTVAEDVETYFKDLFTAFPKKENVQFTADQLVSDLGAYFLAKYNPVQVMQLLQNGYQAADGFFIFKRTDFFPWKMQGMGAQVKEVHNA
jgi:hypothetical protein